MATRAELKARAWDIFTTLGFYYPLAVVSLVLYLPYLWYDSNKQMQNAKNIGFGIFAECQGNEVQTPVQCFNDSVQAVRNLHGNKAATNVADLLSSHIHTRNDEVLSP